MIFLLRLRTPHFAGAAALLSRLSAVHPLPFSTHPTLSFPVQPKDHQTPPDPSSPLPHHSTTTDPVSLYHHLHHAGDATRTSHDWAPFYAIIRSFEKSGWASDRALSIYIPRSLFHTAATEFGALLYRRCPDAPFRRLLSLGPSPDAHRFLFPSFADFCLHRFPDEIRRFRGLLESTDLTRPHTWFPGARAMAPRRVLYHCGPTNSGKTYAALQRLVETPCGVYCGPLRLLAVEVFDKVNALGVPCSLVTGQEKQLVPNSNHVACTVEMASTDHDYDVAVIDEIQMIADPARGHAWTRALLGLRAGEIHLCGDPSALSVVRRVCQEMGDNLEECRCERFKPLVVERGSLQGELKNVRSGDCIVAFSRREIFEVKLVVEKFTKHRCGVIYGALPPETRRQQAALFNEDGNEFDVLVATDAVGMGLNLNIRRVVFYTLSKYNGDKIVPVPTSEVKQIAGRAGRRGCKYPDGLVTTFQLEDLDYLMECLEQPFSNAPQIGLFPLFEQVELFAGLYPGVGFPQLLDMFRQRCHLDASYFFCDLQQIKRVAQMLEKVPSLSLKERFDFCFAPVNIRDPKAMFYLLRFATDYSQRIPVTIMMRVPNGTAKNDEALLDLEAKHKVMSIYLWLAQHFEEEMFPDKEEVEAMATDVAGILGESLVSGCWKPEPGSATEMQYVEEDGYDSDLG